MLKQLKQQQQIMDGRFCFVHQSSNIKESNLHKLRAKNYLPTEWVTCWGLRQCNLSQACETYRYQN